MKFNVRPHVDSKSVPFVGYVGTGSRLILKPEGRGFSIQQSLGSQLWIILGLLAMIVVPMYAILFDRKSIPNGVFSYTVLGFVIAIAVPFFIKFSFRLLGGRRAHVDPIKRRIYFYSSGTKTEAVLDFASIAALKLNVHVFHSDGVATDNFIVVAIDREGKPHEVCITDEKTGAEKVMRQLSQATGVISNT